MWQAATARAAHPRRAAAGRLGRISTSAQNFLTLASSLDTMLAEARKYRLSLVLAHQDLAQFPRDLLAAASANARNKIYFTCSPDDARVLSRHTLPELDEHDLTHLDAYTAATRLVVDGRQTPAFTMQNPPTPAGRRGGDRDPAGRRGQRAGPGHHRRSTNSSAAPSEKAKRDRDKRQPNRAGTAGSLTPDR